jgi:hypothetical protein
MLLLSMEGGLKVTLPQSGFVQQVTQTDAKQLASFVPRNFSQQFRAA